MSLNRDKALPELPLGRRASACEVHATPSSAGSTSDNTKALPGDCWNRSSGTSVHRKRQLGQHMKFPPPPIILPDATKNIPASALSAPTRATRESRSWKLWDMLKGRNKPTSPSYQKARQSFRSKSQYSLRKKLMNAVSAPEISGHANVAIEAEMPQVASPLQEVVPVINVEESRALTQEELMTDDGGIYFLSPIPQDYDPFRPDSPIMHRHRSLCDLATLIRTQEPDFEATASPRVHPIDELHSFIMFWD